MNLQKKIRRNYCSDTVAMYRDIWIYIDEALKSEDGITKEELLRYVMIKGKGHFNPDIVSKEIDKI